MIIIRFTSGLGNQMYQYSFYKLLKEKYKETKVLADLTWFYANNDHHGYELQRIFGQNHDLKIEEASKSQIYKVTGQIPPLVRGKLAKKVVFLEGPINRILREKFHSTDKVNRIDQLDGELSNKWTVDENGQEKNEVYDLVMKLDTSKDWYITGFWIEERFYGQRIDKTRSELTFPDFPDENNRKMLEQIKASDSVSIHVRRGDYLTATYASMFKSLGRAYYEAAVNEMRSRFSHPQFFIFSDDPAYIKEAFEWLDEKTIVDINSGDDSYKDMQLMSNCKGNIVANSTFSQWGALLNQNESSVTVYPSAYLVDEDTEVKQLNGWIRI